MTWKRILCALLGHARGRLTGRDGGYIQVGRGHYQLAREVECRRCGGLFRVTMCRGEYVHDELPHRETW